MIKGVTRGAIVLLLAGGAVFLALLIGAAAASHASRRDHGVARVEIVSIQMKIDAWHDEGDSLVEDFESGTGVDRDELDRLLDAIEARIAAAHADIQAVKDRFNARWHARVPLVGRRL